MNFTYSKYIYGFSRFWDLDNFIISRDLNICHVRSRFAQYDACMFRLAKTFPG